ncbi:MAG: hypothetical protein ACJAVM_001768 [Sulfitobacter sp.]|jgi:hypothetical protein
MFGKYVWANFQCLPTQVKFSEFLLILPTIYQCGGKLTGQEKLPAKLARSVPIQAEKGTLHFRSAFLFAENAFSSGSAPGRTGVKQTVS